MTLLLAVLLIHGQGLDVLWYPVALVAWVLHYAAYQPIARAAITINDRLSRGLT